LGDFGLSRKIAEVISDVPYVDPKFFSYEINQIYKPNEKSNIYSIGVLIWQISSGHKPVHEVNYDIVLAFAIVNGKREEIIYGTPIEYSNLYQGKSY